MLLGSGALCAQDLATFYVKEYRVEGAHRLPRNEVEAAVYPFMGPGRTPNDVEEARLALEAVYQEKGYQTISVSIPDQDPRSGVIRLTVNEGKVARLRIKGSRWFLPSRIRREMPSIAEGSVPDFKQVEKELIAVNKLGDRRVTPDLRPGVLPGDVDIDLNVEDELPLHGSLELNNRYSADTTTLRLNGALSYANMFQLGHTLGLSSQIAPKNLDDGLVYSGYYLARVSEKLSLMAQATKQDSDISTLGGSAVAGAGEIIGLRAMFDLPTTTKFYQNFTLGWDYKSFEEDLKIKKDVIPAPIEYYPLSGSYYATWIEDDHFTEASLSATLGLRGVGSKQTDYDNKRFKARGNFIHLNADVAHTHDLESGAQIFAKVQGQLSDQPLINNEQIAGGGLGTVRGYLEATSLGDNGIFVTTELRSPSLVGTGESSANPKNEWRFHAFVDAGLLGIYDELPGQKDRAGLSSAGFGTRIKYREHYNGSVDVAVPFIEQLNADDGEVRVTFRGWADF
jgi:hemolysin activation/secretion protein